MKDRLISTFYFLLCTLEGLAALISFWSARSTPTPVAIFGLSPGRTSLLLLTGIFTAIFASLSILEFRDFSHGRSPLQRLFGQPARFLLFALVVTLGLLAASIAVFSPLHLPRLLNYYRRWQPLFLWWFLVFIQLMGVALLLRGPAFWVAAWRSLFYGPRIRELYRRLQSPLVGYALLGFSILLGLTKVYFGRFVDEGDNLAVGWLVSQGYSLYQDVFSHHFPFPYYWVALVVRLFGNSFVAARLSLLLLQIGVFALCMACTRLYLPLGLTSLAWNLVNQFHRGQEVIYSAFEGLFLLAVFVLVFWVLVEDPAPPGESSPSHPSPSQISAARFRATRFRATRFRATLVLAGLFSGLALLTDPLAIYPLAVAFLALFISGLRPRGQPRWREGLRRVALAGSAAFLVVGVFALQLLLSGTAAVFFRDTIWFNAEIYAKYVDANPDRLGVVARQLFTGLGITNPEWLRFPSPILPLEPYRSVSLADENRFYFWIFTGFGARLSILACILGVILRRKYLAAGFLYLFSAALLVRAETGIYAIGFTLVALFTAFLLLTRLADAAGIHSEPLSPRVQALAAGAWKSLVVLVAVMAAWPALRGGYFLADYWNTVQDPSHVKMYQKFGDQVHQLTCNQPGVRLAVFPVNPIIYFVTRIPPATRYTFMYPWVAEVGQQEVIDDLRSGSKIVVLMNADRKADSPEGVATYMSGTIRFLNEEYTSVGGELWVSPDISQTCNASTAENPPQP